MNDPMAMFQRDDGSIHVGYQCHPQHVRWGNISNCAAFSKDFTTFEDASGPEGTKTIWPSVLYDIRGVFDGSIIKKGIDGLPTILYTSTFTGPLGAVAGEKEGAETQSLAYTKDNGDSWIKLPYGAGNNPVIYEWPQTADNASAKLNLTGFRDPYVFTAPYFDALLANSSSEASGDHYVTISGGVYNEGGLLMLYRQTTAGEYRDWTYIGEFLRTGLRESWSEWSGNFGINYETASTVRLNSKGEAMDDGSDEDAVSFSLFGTERGREGHEAHWPLWTAQTYSVGNNGSIEAKINYAGVVDWGRSYAFVSFPVNDSRQVLAGWTYEDDPDVVLAKQMGYQGAFPLFRDLYVKRVRGVQPSADLYQKASWAVTNETDGTVSIETLGQKVVPETVEAFRAGSKISTQSPSTVSDGYTPLQQQPTGRQYRMSATFDFMPNATAGAVGFRVLASDQEFTDVLYNAETEELTVVREQSSLIKSFGNDTELAKLKLWKLANTTTTQLKLDIYVDNSIIEVHANDEAFITTRVYPWLEASTGAGLLGANGTSAVMASDIELWDGLVNAFPSRAENTSTGLVWDGPANSIFGLFDGY